jgi:galactose mutarotase-like enzyme
MAPVYGIGETVVDGHAVRVLSTPDGELEAGFAPRVGMVGCSLRHRGEEVLGQRGGLERYAQTGSTFGIPLLHPWANRLEGWEYEVAGTSVHLDAETSPLRPDPNGLPIHGMLAASPFWEVTEATADAGSARLVARFDFAEHPALLAGFPFPHELELAIRLQQSTLGIETTLRATGDRPVPISFGHHPYFHLPNVPRAEWWVEMPVSRRARLDEREIPTGEYEDFEPESGPLGDRTYDDLFAGVADMGGFRLSGGARTVAVTWEHGYDWAQVYAPPDQDLICFEPMTAATNALVSGEGLELVQPGESYTARFSVTVADGER